MRDRRTRFKAAWVPCAWMVFFLGAARGDDLLTVGYGEGVPGSSSVVVPVMARHDLPIHGFSLALRYPRGSLQLLEINSKGTAVDSVGADFYQQLLDNAAGTAVLGVIFSFKDPYGAAALPPTAPGDRPHLLAWLYFAIDAGAIAGEHPIELEDGLGSPPASNRFTYRGTTIKPHFEDGLILVQSENVLTLESKLAFPGFPIYDLYAFARHPMPLTGFQVAVAFDPRALELTNATFDGTSMLSLIGGYSKIEFSLIEWKPEEIAVSPTENRTTVGVIFDHLPPYNDKQVLPPETSSTTKQSIMKYSFLVKDGADQFGESIPLSLKDSLEPGAINNTFIVDSLSFPPHLVDGRVYFSTGNIQGKVVSFDTGNPISGATVTLEPAGTSVKTVTNGTFLFTSTMSIPVPAGPFSGTVSKAGFYPGRIQGTVAGLDATSDAGTVVLFSVPPSQGGFKRGLVNADGRLDISDGIALLGYLFLGETAPTCMDAADVNDDGYMDISDAISIFKYLFTGDTPPKSPFATCGQDPTPADTLGCVRANGCGL